MIIFEQEKKDGIEHKMLSNASINYTALVEPCEKDNIKKDLSKSVASLADEDLYYVQSILVSSSWNKNDDVFDKVEVWNARATPEHKPTNLEHDEKLIVGHITSNWPITDDGILIDANTDVKNLPNKYHILTGSVIYRGFSDPELRDRAERLIAEIESGDKYVSMECFFKGFDYSLEDKSNGSFSIIERNEDTSHLTKHLKVYGGLGEKDNYKIGRLLRNITFSGKGFVAKPANEDSIIFNRNTLMDKLHQYGDTILEKKNDEFNDSGVSNTQQSIITETEEMNKEEMSAAASEQPSKDCHDLTSQANALNETINTLNETINTLKQEHEVAMSNKQEQVEQLVAADEVTQKSISELQTQITELSTAQEEAGVKIADLETAKTEAEAAIKTLEEAKEAVELELTAANEVIAGYKEKEAEMEKKEKKMARKAALEESGVDSVKAAELVDQFESMDDETFVAMTSVFSSLVPAPEAVAEEVEAEVEAEAGMPPALKEALEKKKKKKEEEGKASESDELEEAKIEADVDASVLENVEVEEDSAITVGGEVESKEESTRAALVDFVRSRIGKK